MASSLDAVDRIDAVRDRIQRKAGIRQWYAEIYQRDLDCLARCPHGGMAVEIGSGGGFAQDVIPGIVTTDVLSYPGLDRVIDARDMAFEDGSLRMICMLNVFHHIPDVEAFLREASRCLCPGGRMLIVDQHPGIFARPILKHFHHEPFDRSTASWQFNAEGPLSGANGALAWIVFHRDRERFDHEYPQLRLVRYETHSPLRYWLFGGLRAWTAMPGWMFGPLSRIDTCLSGLAADFGSFVDIELVRVAP